MSDESALLAAIFAHPDEDTPRLIYADWLQENGQPERAEFIRLQIKLTSEYTTANDNRQDKLEDEYRAAWTAHLPRDQRLTYSPWEWKFARGMPEVLWCDAAGFVEHHGALTSGTHIRDLFLCDATTYWLLDLAQIGWPESVVSLAVQECPRTPIFIGGYDCTNGIEALAAMPQLSRLRSLRLSIYHLTERAVRALTESLYFNDSVQLEVDHCWMTPLAVELLRARFGSHLEYHAPRH